MKIHRDLYARMIEPTALFRAWELFRRGKRSRPDVAEFEYSLESHIFALHRELSTKTYQYSEYSSFYITDPKQRHIHKAIVRDRVVHHAVFQVLNPIFEPTFIAHSFSCRVGKGTHKGVDTIKQMSRKVSQNHTRACYALKCDVKRFFDSIDHDVLVDILARRIKDDDVMWLLNEIIRGFTHDTLQHGKGLPIGNLTSQLFANVYMNEFDQFVKHDLRIKHYARYTDDFIILNHDRDALVRLIPQIQQFLTDNLHLSLHPHKVTVRTLQQGVDFLGYVVRPYSVTLRTKTKRRMLRNLAQKIRMFNEGMLNDESLIQTVSSYLGVLSHGNCEQLEEYVMSTLWCELEKPLDLFAHRIISPPPEAVQ